jgi:hypothetical protein
MLTPKELREELGHHFSALVRQFYRAETFMRIPLVTGFASSGVLSLASNVGPNQGYAWDIGFLGVAGLTVGTTPDIANMYFAGGATVPWWQFNGNTPMYTFSRGQMVMLPGETISLQSVGTFAATGEIILYGAIRTQMPTERLEKVVG